MKLSHIVPTSTTYSYQPNYYHGKDIVHSGILLEINPQKSYPKLHKEIRRSIRIAQKNSDIKIKKVKGTFEDIQNFRTIAYSSDDPSLPDQLRQNEHMYLAYLRNKLVAGIILTPVGNNLFMHNHASSKVGKKNHIATYIIWHALKDLKDSPYQHIDIGVSFRKSLYDYFKKWSTSTYPIIFEPPVNLPDIRLTPAENKHISIHKGSSHYLNQAQPLLNNKSYTVLPRAINAIQLILKYLKLNKNDFVTICKTLNDNKHISRCLTETIESTCNWNQKITNKTKAVMLLHEFGYPVADSMAINKKCKSLGIPLIENCTWGLGSSLNNGKSTTGNIGDFVILSLPKIFSMSHGSLLFGCHISDLDNWNKYGLLDHYKREIILDQLSKEIPRLDKIIRARRRNWIRLDKLFSQDGYEPLIKLEHGIYPAVYLLKLNTTEEMNQLHRRFASFGIEVGRYYSKKSLYLPIHQNITIPQLQYIYAVFRGYLNLCRQFRRKKS